MGNEVNFPSQPWMNPLGNVPSWNTGLTPQQPQQYPWMRPRPPRPPPMAFPGAGGNPYGGIGRSGRWHSGTGATRMPLGAPVGPYGQVGANQIPMAIDRGFNAPYGGLPNYGSLPPDVMRDSATGRPIRNQWNPTGYQQTSGPIWF